jgi:hypothetical protein
MHDLFRIHPDVLDLAELERRRWSEISARITGPRNEGPGNGGGSGDGGQGGNGGSGDGGAGAGAGGSGDGGGQGGAGGSGSGGDGGGAGGEWSPPDRGAWDNTQRQLREAKEKADRLEREKQDRERKEAEDKGEFKKLADAEKARADKLEADLARDRAERRVEKIARRLNFRDPDDVIGKLSDDELSDDSKTEKALKDLAKNKPYLLVDGEKPKQGDLKGDGGSGGGGADDAPIAGPGRMSRAYASSGQGR